MISLAAIVNTSCLWDPSWVSYALEQQKMLRSHNYMSTNFMYNYSVRPLYVKLKELCLVLKS